MKSKSLFITLLLIFTAQLTFGQGRYISQTQYVYQRPVYRQEVIRERVVVQEEQKKDNSQVGLILRGGYSYNDDAVTYGASVYYHFSGVLGISVGFDGYYIPNLKLYDEFGNVITDDTHKNFPMWDMRAGFLLGRYFAFGGILGKCQICTPQTVHEKKNMWGRSVGNGIYGGYITFILPITDNFGMNMDFAMTNHTGFNIGIGFNIYMAVKTNNK